MHMFIFCLYRLEARLIIRFVLKQGLLALIEALVRIFVQLFLSSATTRRQFTLKYVNFSMLSSSLRSMLMLLIVLSFLLPSPIVNVELWLFASF